MKNNSIKKQTDLILNLYTIIALVSVVAGVLIDSDFLLLMGAILAILGAVFVNNLRTKHITNILKQNNLWTDEVFEKAKKDSNVTP